MKFEASDVASLPNAISATGFAMVLDGLHRGLDTFEGLTEVSSGRILDLVDGKVARATGQTSEFGAAVDATLDKLGGLVIVANEWRNDIAPKAALAAILAQNIANTAATAVAAKNNPAMELSPTSDGKRAMAAQNVALYAYALGRNFEHRGHETVGKVARFAGHTATAVGVGYYGIRATRDYFKRARKS